MTIVPGTPPIVVGVPVYPNGEVNTGITTTTPSLIGDLSAGTGAGNNPAQTLPTLTRVQSSTPGFPNSLPINAALEIQSTNGAFILPRMTCAQAVNLLTPQTVNPSGGNMSAIVQMVPGAMIIVNDVTSNSLTGNIASNSGGGSFSYFCYYVPTSISAGNWVVWQFIG